MDYADLPTSCLPTPIVQYHSPGSEVGAAIARTRMPARSPMPTALPPESWPALPIASHLAQSGVTPVEPVIEPAPGEPDALTPPIDVPVPTADPLTKPILVQQVKVLGSTLFTQADLAPLTQSVLGKTVSPAELQALADQITQKYLNQGYITSRAILDETTLANAAGVVTIRVIEGSVERIEVKGTRRLHPDYVIRRVRLGTRAPLNAARLEDQLRLLRADPLFKNVDASLRAGENLGQSLLVVRVVEVDAWTGSVGVDNYSPPSVGSEEVATRLTYRNLSGNGDQLGAGYSRSLTGGAENYGLSYQVPLNPMDGTLQLRANWNRNKITLAPFDVLDIRGRSQLYDLTYRQPLWRSPRQEFALSFGFAYQNGQTFSFNSIPTPFGIGPDADGFSRTSIFKFGQEYIRRDVKGAWSARSLFSLGTGLFKATRNSGDIPDGQFFSWLGQVQRAQRLHENHLLLVQTAMQFSTDPLLPAQQFAIGGGYSVRGYRENARAGDNGIRFSVEDRITVQRDASGLSVLQIAPFAEAAVVWNNDRNPNRLPAQTFLPTVGLGILWQPTANLNLRLDYGIPLVNLRDRGSNIQDDGFHFSLSYQF
jgi:hemolysin activation/secretion protein